MQNFNSASEKVFVKVFAQLEDKFFLVMKGQERIKWSNIFGLLTQMD
jgi:hypothetical protein